VLLIIGALSMVLMEERPLAGPAKKAVPITE
jgi:hypothetical protein